MRRVWERYGKGMGKVWERYGKGIGKVWERYEKSIHKVSGSSIRLIKKFLLPSLIFLFLQTLKLSGKIIPAYGSVG